jgi:hypothetical protein
VVTRLLCECPRADFRALDDNSELDEIRDRPRLRLFAASFVVSKFDEGRGMPTKAS